jgi:hypothetical protein
LFSSNRWSEEGQHVNLLTGINDAAKPLRSQLLAVPAFRARYLAYAKEIAGSPVTSAVQRKGRVRVVRTRP